LSDFDKYLQAKGILQDRDDIYYQEQPAGGQSKDGRLSRLKYEDSVEGWCAREANKFIEAAGDAPWLMHLSFPRPHQIYSPSSPFWEMYPDDLPMPPNADADLSLKPPHLRRTRELQATGKRDMPLFGEKTYEAQRRRKLRGYYGLITQTDHAIGEVLDGLRARGLEEDTIVIYVSDHGEYACQFGLLEKAPGICSDAVTRVPLIWRWPGHFKSGHECAQIVQPCVDFTATICGLAGLPEFSPSDGKDISPLLRGEDIELHTIGVTEHPWSKSVRKGSWRFVYYPRGMFNEPPDQPVGELYNLDEDPWEMNNLFYDPAYQDKVAELRLDLMDWLSTTQRMETTNPPIDPAADGRVGEKEIRDCCQKGIVSYI